MQRIRWTTCLAGMALAACGGGEGTPPPPPVALVTVTPPSALITEGGSQQFTAVASDATGQTVSATISWQSTVPSVASVTSTGFAAGLIPGETMILATAGGVTGSATLTVQPEGLRIATADLAAGRLTIAYEGAVKAEGGVGGYTFAVVSGSLPDGLNLQPDGEITGTPGVEGVSDFTVRVTDSQNETTDRALSLTVCEAPQPFALGEVRTSAPAPLGSCGTFLPSGAAGDRYRVALVRNTTAESTADIVQATLAISGFGVLGSPPAPAPQSRDASGARARVVVDQVGDDAWRRLAEGTVEAHARLRESEAELLARIGAEHVLPDLRDRFDLRTGGVSAPLPDRILVDPTTPSSCSPAGSKTVALKIAENDFIGIYQDSVQNFSASTAITPVQALVLLEFYEDHGKEVVDEYFGGVPDVNADGKVTVLFHPVVTGNQAAFVWSGDFFDPGVCPASNGMEIVFMNHVMKTGLAAAGASQAMETLVHEMKHVSSLYERTQRDLANGGNGGGAFNPTWWEEGVAEIAGGVASRLAWAAQGGMAPAVTDMLNENHWRMSGLPVEDETFGVFIRVYRTQEYLASQPNGLVATPSGARPLHSIYGSGWTFARWLGDAYGEAGDSRLNEAGFWRQLNDRLAQSGIDGIEDATGEPWAVLLEQYAAALMLNAQPAPPPARAFTSFDFASSIELFCVAADNPPCPPNQQPPDPPPPGTFPWPVTTNGLGVMSRPFLSDSFTGSVGPAGIRIHEFVSDGSGDGAEVNVTVPGPARVVVARVN